MNESLLVVYNNRYYPKKQKKIGGISVSSPKGHETIDQPFPKDVLVVMLQELYDQKNLPNQLREHISLIAIYASEERFSHVKVFRSQMDQMIQQAIIDKMCFWDLYDILKDTEDKIQKIRWVQLRLDKDNIIQEYLKKMPMNKIHIKAGDE